MEIIIGINSFSARTREVRGGFTLLELLMVMAIIAVLSLSLPAIQSVVTAGTFDSNASKMSDMLREAYSAALAKKTYVWVGFLQMANNGGVGMGAVYSQSGNPTDINTPGNLTPLFKPAVLPNLSLTTVNSSQISDSNRATQSVGQVFSTANILDVPNTTSPVAFSASIGGATQSIVSASSQPFTTVLEITPSGQVTISSNNKYAWIEIGLQPIRGNSKEVAVLQMNSFTGRVLQFLP